jgi:hypothetical protein
VAAVHTVLEWSRRRRLTLAFVLLATCLIAALATDRFFFGESKNSSEGNKSLAGGTLSPARLLQVTPRPTSGLFYNKPFYSKASPGEPSSPGGDESPKLFLARLGAEPTDLALPEESLVGPESFAENIPDGPLVPLANMARVPPEPDTRGSDLPLPNPGRGPEGPEFIPSNPTIVPEPSTWFLLIAGFGVVGAMLRHLARRNSRRTPEVGAAQV